MSTCPIELNKCSTACHVLATYVIGSWQKLFGQKNSAIVPVKKSSTAISIVFHCPECLDANR